MNITIKESMLLRKCIGHFVSSQLLDFDKSPLFMDLITESIKKNIKLFLTDLVLLTLSFHWENI